MTSSKAADTLVGFSPCASTTALEEQEGGRGTEKEGEMEEEEEEEDGRRRERERERVGSNKERRRSCGTKGNDLREARE